MRDGRNSRKQVVFATVVAAFLMASAARAQTPIPTLPPLPPLPSAVESATPAPAAAQPAAEPLSTPAPSAGQPAAAPVATPAPSRPAERSAVPEASGGLPSSVVILLGIGALVLVATLVVVLTVILKKPVVINVPSRSATPPPIPEAPAAPPPGPLDVLPGRFLIDDGDQQVELHIFRTAPGDRVETTIGRDPGPAYRHIQLLPASVAGKHAKLVFDRRSYSLINYARSNPTRVNGEEIEENASRRLVDNDRIEIGDVVMTYRED
ncbi:MAG: FHA domain-containing protein [Acidobacteriota bacterium]